MTRKEFALHIAALGGTIEETDGRTPDYNVEAPRGYTWDGDLHCMVVGPTLADRDDFFTRFTSPIPCTDVACEYCNEL